jgi:hypothetical protein
MEFSPICVYLVIGLLLSLILIGVSFLFASSSSLVYPKKLSAYECGFDPLDVVFWSGKRKTYGLERTFLFPPSPYVPTKLVTFSMNPSFKLSLSAIFEEGMLSLGQSRYQPI